MTNKKIPALFKKPSLNITHIIIVAALLTLSFPPHRVGAIDCPDLRIIFARGSGGEHGNTADYLEFKRTIEKRLGGSGLEHEYIDLDYPAVGIGVDNIGVTLGAYFGSGDAYEFGDSVNAGVKNLKNMVNSSSCPNTKYIIGGYSQGAIVVSKSLAEIIPERLIYAATFGDPKIFLPEGEGFMPVACKGENLSDYRAYVPDCHAYEGLLGAIKPYQPVSLLGKVGTWCNKNDILCSSHLSISDHVSYISDNLYSDAANIIYSKVAQHFNLENRVASEHDTAILIDSTGSMASFINDYKNEAYRLAKETLESGGRVALYDYRDLSDPYELHERCNFETCTLESFQEHLSGINANGGGDDRESLLSASFNTMKTLNWKFGATKSLVVLTDAGFLEPDRDGVTIEEVISLSKSIDPVNFYIITKSKNADEYQDLAARTDGKVITNLDELNLLTDFIMERADSLPKVEEDATVYHWPTITINSTSQASTNEATINFETNVANTMVALNGRILGTTTERVITISGLNPTVDNEITLVPITKDIRGKAEVVLIKAQEPAPHEATEPISPETLELDMAEAPRFILPKAPNTGYKNEQD